VLDALVALRGIDKLAVCYGAARGALRPAKGAATSSPSGRSGGLCFLVPDVFSENLLVSTYCRGEVPPGPEMPAYVIPLTTRINHFPLQRPRLRLPHRALQAFAWLCIFHASKRLVWETLRYVVWELEAGDRLWRPGG
jgi:hypothetical protein